jgi:dephospho-CoA kinase
MSGTGKSSAVRALAARGYKAIDTDDGWSEPLPDGRQMWREDAIQALLATEDTEVLFVAGCEENQAKFHAQFDHIILLSAPLETLVERLATRTSNSYGKHPKSSAVSSMTSTPLSRCCGKWLITRSGQRCRWTRW